MSYSMKPLGCDPQHVKGMSEKLIVSHYENNYGGAVSNSISSPSSSPTSTSTPRQGFSSMD